MKTEKKITVPLYLHATVWDLFFVYKHFVEKGEEISAIEQKRITEVLILSNLASIHQIEGTKRPPFVGAGKWKVSVSFSLRKRKNKDVSLSLHKYGNLDYVD